MATLRELHEREPGNELTFIVGADMAETLPAWREPRELLRLAQVAVAERGESRRAGIAARIAELEPGDRVRYFDMPRIEISSTLLRARAARGESLRYFTTDGVAREVAERGLYGGGGAA